MAPFVALTGFMGSGKSSVGAAVAELLEIPFVDLDSLFVETENLTIADFFSRHGEAAFRAREVDLLQSVLDRSGEGVGLVVALGGGTLENPASGSLLAARGGVVYLDVSADEAWKRVRNTGRPLATDRDSFDTLLARRRSVYEAAADWILPVAGVSVGDLAQEIAGLVRRMGNHWQGMWGRRLTGTDRQSLVLGGEGALEAVAPQAKAVAGKGHRFFVITDSNVVAHWGDDIAGYLGEDDLRKVLVLAPGEGSKSLDTLGRCWDWLSDRGARRDDVVVALGGGVVGDVAGFAAATYQRGLSLWQVPTSLLAQVDSSVGGKTAINLAAGKNLVGAFYQPDLVAADPKVLQTLPEREFVGGLAEVVKHSLLMSESAFTELEEERVRVCARESGALVRCVKMSVNFKAGVVEGDERESGRRAILNLGHTIGHALEVVEGYGSLSHGEAVGLGLIVALAVSERVLGLDESVRLRTTALLADLGLPVAVTLPDTELLLSAASRDKKQRAGSSGFVGLRAIGEPIWGLDVPPTQLASALGAIVA